MRRMLVIGVALALAVAAGCSEELSKYERALDNDREAREKMTAAIDLMVEAAELEESVEELTEAEQEAIAGKRNEAVDAYLVAVESWAAAEELYRELMEEHPDDPVYLNNLANLFYNKVEKGVGTDSELAEAERMFREALEAHEREMFETNLQLVLALSEDEETRERVSRNRNFVSQLARLAEESED